MSSIGRLVAKLRGDHHWNQKLSDLDMRITRQLLLSGRTTSELMRQKKQINSLHEVEFAIFSQFGDDGIIQWLVHRMEMPNHIFVEFGVEDYKIANTRFLLVNDEWSGLVMDGSPDNISSIINSEIAFSYDLKAHCAWITAENINEVLSDQGMTGEIGLLHIDVDGNDYWIWRAIEVVRPAIVVMEYNSVFGSERPITIPYDPKFLRGNAHPSLLYCGASIAALCSLAEERGYDFVGSNRAGNNAYFVDKKIRQGVPALTPEEGYVESRFAEYVDPSGQRVHGAARLDVIRGLPVVNVKTGEIEHL